MSVEADEASPPKGNLEKNFRSKRTQIEDFLVIFYASTFL